MRIVTKFTASLSLCLAALLVFSATSRAGSLYNLALTGVGGTSAGGVYTGVYSLTENGQPLLAFCDDFDTHTYVGATWSANRYTVADLSQLKFNNGDAPGALSSDILQDYEAIMFLGGQLYSTPASDPQRINDLSFAIWGIFSPDARANSAYDAAAYNFDQTALHMEYAPNQFSSWVIWTPDPASASQEFLSPTVPEPGALMFMGLGLMGLALFVRLSKRATSPEQP